MRIGLVTPSWPGTSTANGIATAVAHLAEGLTELGHEVSIVSLGPSDADPSAAVFELPPYERLTIAQRLRSRASRVAKQRYWSEAQARRIVGAAQACLRERRIEALVMEETWGWAAEVQAALPVPVVLTLHGPWRVHRYLQSDYESDEIDALRIARENAAIHCCAAITAPSHDVLERMRISDGPFSGPTQVIRNPMPAGTPMDRGGLTDRERRSLLFVGRFDRHKGGDLMLEAFELLRSRGLDASLTFVGPDPGVLLPSGERLHLETALARLPEVVRERITVTGKLDKTRIAELRRRHGIAVIPSRYETLSYTMLEALASGAATVSFDQGGPAEVLQHGETGLLAAPEDPASLADALQRVLEDQELADRLGAAGVRQIRDEFAPDRVATQTVNLIRCLA